MALFKRIQHTIAALAGVLTLQAALPAQAQTAPQADPQDAVETAKPVDPCVTLVSPALRMARGCVGDVTMNPDYNTALQPRNLHQADQPLLLTVEEAMAVQSIGSPLVTTLPQTYRPSCSNLKAPPIVDLNSPYADPNTIVVWGRRDCEDDRRLVAMLAQQQEAEFGNQPSEYDQFAEAISSPFGRFASNLVINVGFGRYSNDADKAARNEIQDALADLIVGDAHSCEDPMENPESRRNREFMGRFMAQQRGVEYDACRR